jgi:hypothetical protein
MNMFWYIYTIGVVVALFVENNEFKKWCVKNRIDPSITNNDYSILLAIAVSSIGSWLSVALWYYTRDKD